MTYRRTTAPEAQERRSLKNIFRDLLDKPALGLNQAECRYLRQALQIIPDKSLAADGGTWFVSQSHIARTIERDPSTVRRIEKRLEEKGYIERRTGANGRRSGEDRLGISLAPLVARLSSLREIVEQSEARQRALDGVLSRIRDLRRKIMKQIADGSLPEAMAVRIALAIQTKWPRQIATLPADKAARHLLHLEAIEHWRNTFFSHYLSDEPRENERSNTGSEKDLICNARENQEQRDRRKITLQTMEDLKLIATPQMRDYFDLASTGRNSLSLANITVMRGTEMGIERSCLEHAIGRLGPKVAFTLLLLIDGNRHRTVSPIIHPGRYLTAMVRKALTGELNLNKGLIALRNRLVYDAAVM